MKLRVTVLLPGGGRRDVTLACDAATTVGEAAEALDRLHPGGVTAAPNAARGPRRGRTTLRGGPAGRAEWLLDPLAPLGHSGLQSGWRIRAVDEFAGGVQRAVPAAGLVDVLSGPQRGARFSLVTGTNTVGRDPRSRVLLRHASVSRRHAVIDVGARLVLRDLGSANGSEVRGRRVTEAEIVGSEEVWLGSIRVRVTPWPQTPEGSDLPPEARRPHTRAPRVIPHLHASARELPAPPRRAQRGRLPVLAMLAPALMGGAFYAVSGSAASLVMVALSPVMLLGSWLDGRLTARRGQRGADGEFGRALAAEREALTELRAKEIAARAAETPAPGEIAAAMREGGPLLWARRPEHASFLELRLGEGALPSRTETVLPKRGEASGPQWDAIEAVAREFATVAPVPVTERLDRSGSIGVAGPAEAAHGLARSLLVQLTGLHSPAELLVAALAGGERESESWEWLKWFPHTEHLGGKTPVWPLANDADAALRLIVALEEIAEARRGGVSGAARAPGPRAGVSRGRDPGAGPAQTIRSSLAANAGAQPADDTVRRLPVTPAIVVLVLNDGLAEPHRSRLIALAEDGPDLGMHCIWVADRAASLPAACRTFVELEAGEGSTPPGAAAHFVRLRQTVPLARVAHLDPSTATELALAIAPVADTAARALDESDLPLAVQLREIHDADLVGGPGPLLRNWRRSGSLVREWRSGEARAEVSLAAAVGQGPEGPTVLDLRRHGPHALVGGTTGAGKSEFLQTWIMSLAANVSPDRLTFLLVDYKGGAAFAECVELPHTVGLVTDLSPHLVRRALTALRAELRRREELLAEHGAKDLITMEQRSDPAAPPVLVIVIDEFAALASDVPEFVDGVLDIAQRGRSLGLHLVMATQRPAGVVTDNLRANTNLRIALRMADEAESRDVLGVPDAALFDPETPGRAAMKVGAGRVEHFQTGYLGGRGNRGPRPARLEVRTLGFGEGEPWQTPGEQPVETRQRAGAARDIERLRDALAAAAVEARVARPRKPWLPTLPASVRLDALPEQSGPTVARGVPVGLIDLPEAQAQEPVRIDLDETGNLAVFGASGTGKTTALLTLAAAASAAAAADPVHIYAIDAGGGGLDPLAALPTVGAVAPIGDTELTQRVLSYASEIIGERQRRFAAARAHSLPAYRAHAGGEAGREARVLLLIDGFAALREAIESFGERGAAADQLGDIMRAGRAVGVHVALTAERAAALPSALAASVQRRLVLRLASPNDYASLDTRSDVLAAAEPGRCVFAGRGEAIQLAIAGESPDLAGQASALEGLGRRLRDANLVLPHRIRNAPKRLALSELPAEVEGLPVYGIDTRTLRGACLPLRGLGVIAGPPASGLTSATRSCVRAIERWAGLRGEPVDRALVSFASAPGLDGGPIAWDVCARGEAEAEILLPELVRAIGGKPHLSVPGVLDRLGSGIGEAAVAGAGSGAVAGSGSGAGVRTGGGGSSGASEALEFPRPGHRGVIVVERPADADGSDALPQLVALARAARRASVLVLFEFEQGSGGAWDLHAALKQPTWGLALQPDEHEGQTPFRESFGRVSRAAFPPGRGFAVERGTVTPVHVALP